MLKYVSKVFSSIAVGNQSATLLLLHLIITANPAQNVGYFEVVNSWFPAIANSF